MAVHVAMIVRNEMERYLERALECARSVAKLNHGVVVVTDDASTDGTAEFARAFTDYVRVNDEPQFMVNEGCARQAHYEWTSEFVTPGDWVLSLDADETVNRPDIVSEKVRDAERTGSRAILMPLFEFWSEDPPLYRTDGYWHGSLASRLYRFEHGGRIRDKDFGCGSEPTYVAEHVKRRKVLAQNDLHLMHWGYSRLQDRLEKYRRYSERQGGHGHNDRHIKSIVDSNPTLREYL